MSERLVVANWKTSVTSVARARALARAVMKRAPAKVTTVLCPSFVHLSAVGSIVRGRVKLGSQGGAPGEGAYTGEVHADALLDLGVSYAIVGHSEARSLCADAHVALRLKHLVSFGIRPILCVGERAEGAAGEHFSFIEAQLRSALDGLSPAQARMVIVAYEPVWAIGKSAAEAPQGSAVYERVILIRKTLADFVGRSSALKAPVLYGGAVEPQNARGLVEDGGVQGFLVGHASLNAEALYAIGRALQP